MNFKGEMCIHVGFSLYAKSWRTQSCLEVGVLLVCHCLVHLLSKYHRWF